MSLFTFSTTFRLLDRTLVLGFTTLLLALDLPDEGPRFDTCFG